MRKIVFFTVFFILIAIASYFLKEKMTPEDYFSAGLEAYTEKNYARALRLLKKSDRPEAFFTLGAMHFTGKGVPENKEIALFLYKKAADLNYAPALTTLGILYAEEKKLEEAMSCLEKAAALNDGDALILLAKWYQNGINVERNYPKAVEYYEAAAKAGVLDAETALYIIYSNGKKGVPRNLYKAIRHRSKVEKQNELLKKLRPSEKK